MNGMTTFMAFLASCAESLQTLRVQMWQTTTLSPVVPCVMRKLTVMRVDGWLNYGTTEWVRSLIEQSPNLRYVYLERLDDTYPLLALATHCPQLEELHFDYAHDDEPALITLLQTCASLHTLDFLWTNCSDQPPVAVVARHGHSIRALRFDTPVDWSLESAAKLLPRLQHLALYYDYCESEVRVRQLAQHCRSLKSLSIDIPAGTKVSLEAWTELFRSLPALEELSVGASMDIPSMDIILATIAAHCPRLTRAALRNYDGLSTESLFTVLAKCPLLVEINTLRSMSFIQDRKSPFLGCSSLGGHFTAATGPRRSIMR
jgi:hypothetical protein